MLIQGDVARAADVEVMVATTVKVLDLPAIVASNAGGFPAWPSSTLEDVRLRKQ